MARNKREGAFVAAAVKVVSEGGKYRVCDVAEKGTGKRAGATVTLEVKVTAEDAGLAEDE